MVPKADIRLIHKKKFVFGFIGPWSRLFYKFLDSIIVAKNKFQNKIEDKKLKFQLECLIVKSLAYGVENNNLLTVKYK